jgi:hypothetical protein
VATSRGVRRERAFGLYPLRYSRVPHICLVLADVGYRSPSPHTCRGLHNSVWVPYVRTSVARISYYAALTTTAHAAFSQRKPDEVAQRHEPRQEIRDTWAENDGRSPSTALCSSGDLGLAAQIGPGQNTQVSKLEAWVTHLVFVRGAFPFPCVKATGWP